MAAAACYMCCCSEQTALEDAMHAASSTHLYELSPALPAHPCTPILQAAIYQFVGGQLPPSGKAVDGLKTWQRTTLQHLGLLQANSSSSPSSSSSSSEAAGSSTANGQQHQPEAAAAAAPLVVRIGGEPPVSPELLAAVRVVLATVSESIAAAQRSVAV